jgi:hypothetical protein
MLEKLCKDLKYYTVTRTNKCIMEDGEYQHNRDETFCGYAVINTETEIIEVTSQNLANAIFNAEYLDKALDTMLNPKEEQIEIDYDAVAGQLM